MKKIVEIKKESGKKVSTLVNSIENPEYFTSEVAVAAPEKEIKESKEEPKKKAPKKIKKD